MTSPTNNFDRAVLRVWKGNEKEGVYYNNHTLLGRNQNIQNTLLYETM